MRSRTARQLRIRSAVVFLLLSFVVLGPLIFDADELTSVERTLRIVGGIILILLAAGSLYRPRRQGDGN
ncbi:hypothetical protein ACFY3U_02850 [Micromonospora sp. NPDC000089]|uniref:hypothetical protein n=1 Tax=unclassified Micromonospora TaxID=2617518 RepID=UPI00369AABCC